MPRKSASSAVQRGGTIENENISRRSTRSSLRHDSSGSITSRTRRSSTTAQTAVSLAESRVTRSRNSGSRNRSSSPPENTRTRPTREISLESPASRVKTTRRSTGRVNYQESEGEEDMTSTTEKNEEEEYHVEDDLEESDSEESNRSRTRSRATTKSPPKVRGRGRGRPPKTTKGKSSWYASAEENFDEDEDDDDDDDEDEDSDEKVLEESNTIDETVTTRKNNKLENESESIRKTRGTKRKIQTDSLSARSTRSGKITKDIENEKKNLSSSTRQTRSRKLSSETANVAIEDVEMKKDDDNADETKEEMEGIKNTEEKKKRKLDVKKEAKKRFKSEDLNSENENTKCELKENNEKSEFIQEKTKTQHDDKELKDHNKEILSKPCENKDSNLILVDKTIAEEVSNKNSNNESMKKEISDSLSFKENTPTSISEKICKETTNLQNDDIMEVDESTSLTTGEKTNSEILSIKTDNSNKEEKNIEYEINKEKKLSENISPEMKDYSTSTLKTQIENKLESCDKDINSQIKILQSNKDYKSDLLPSSKVSSSEVTNLISTDNKEADTLQTENLKSKGKFCTGEETATTKSDTLPLEKSDSQDSSKQIEEPVDLQEKSLKDTENNPPLNKKENASSNLSYGVLQLSKSAFSEKNTTNLGLTEVLSVNGANICTEKIKNSNESDDIIDMSKVSDHSASQTENVAVESFLQAPSHIECLTKANGAPNNSKQSSNLNFIGLPNRKYIYNSSLSEDSKNCLQDKMFSLVSYNLSAMSNESSPQNEKLFTELKRTIADFICLQEISKKYYDILESDFNVLGYKGLISVPENKTRGLGIFYKTSSFHLKRHAGLSLQKIIDQDLETSSLENEDKVAIRNFLQKCGHTLMAQFSTVNKDCSLTIANVFFPPSDVSTHALQMSSLVREVVKFSADIARPHVLCGSFNMVEGGVAYQLLREGYLNNDMIEELQKRKDVALPGKDNDTLVNLLWKAFQHPSSNLRSCYATVLGHELHLDGENSVISPDLLWYSSDSLETVGVLDVIPVDKNNVGPVTLKADIAYIC